jgi:hypothetical protein
VTTTVIAGGDSMFALAKLMLDADDARAAADDQDLRSARQEQQRELETEVQELHQAAADTRTGALLEGGFAIAGGAVSAIGVASEPTHAENTGRAAITAFQAANKQGALADRVGQLISGSGKPLGKMFGDAPAADAEAEAKHHEALAADASARATETLQHHDRVLDNEDRTLATLQSTLESNAEGNLALIANV